MQCIILWLCALLAVPLTGLDVLLEEERPLTDQDYDPELALEQRANHLQSVCWKYEDISRPEHPGVIVSEVVSHPSCPSVVFDIVEPSFQVCAPPHTAISRFLWQDYRDKAQADIGENLIKSKKGIEKRLKIVTVEHPFQRLARAYLTLFKDGRDHEDEFKEIRQRFGRREGEMLTFRDMARFLTRAGHDFGPDSVLLTSSGVYDAIVPYYRACPVCHKHLLPSYVLKSDCNFEEDLEYLEEVFGLDLVEFPMENVKPSISDSTLRALYSQLSKEELTSLVEIYRIDMEMYQYSPAKFYEIVS